MTRVVVSKCVWVTHVASCLYFSSDYSSHYSGDRSKKSDKLCLLNVFLTETLHNGCEATNCVSKRTDGMSLLNFSAAQRC